MAWTILGNARGLLLGVSANGNSIIRGKGSHIPYFPDHPGYSVPNYTAIRAELNRLQKVETDWRILPSQAVHLYPMVNAELKKHVAARPELPFAQIGCYDRPADKDDPALSFTIALPSSMFEQVHELFSNVLSSPNEIEYNISVGFSTFGLPSGLSTQLPTPILDEFINGVPYISDEVSFSVERAPSSWGISLIQEKIVALNAFALGFLQSYWFGICRLEAVARAGPCQNNRGRLCPLK